MPKNSQTLFLIFNFEDDTAPTYRIDNQSQSVMLELTQQGITPVSDQLIISYRPGSQNLFSWTDPEQSKLCLTVWLKKLDGNGGAAADTLQKYTVRLDDLKFCQTIKGRFSQDHTAGRGSEAPRR